MSRSPLTPTRPRPTRRHRHGGRVQLASETRLVARLEDAGLAKQRAHGVRRLRAVVEPVVDAIALEIERRLTRTRSVLADDFDELAVARARESATTIRYMGCFLRPVRRRRILTAIDIPHSGF